MEYFNKFLNSEIVLAFFNSLIKILYSIPTFETEPYELSSKEIQVNKKVINKGNKFEVKTFKF